MHNHLHAELLMGLNTLRSRLDNAQGVLSRGSGDAVPLRQELGGAFGELAGTVLEVVCEGVVTLSATGIICASNRRFSEMTGTMAGQVVGIDFSSLVYPGDHSVLTSHLEKAENEGHPLLLNLRGLNGAPVPVRVTAHRLRHGQLGETCLVMRELSETHAATEAYARLAAIVSTAEEAIIGASLSGTITSWNRAAERVYGYRAEEMVGNHLSALAPAECLGDLDKIARALEQEAVLNRLETRHQHKDGHRIDVSLSLSPIWSAYGELDGMALVVHDITSMKRSERAVRDSQRFIQKVADTAPYLLYVFDPVTQSAIYCNSRLLDLLGYELTLPFVPPDIALDLCHPDDQHTLEEAFARCAVMADGERVEVERRVRHARGEWRWFKSIWTVFSRNEDGSPAYLMGIAQDTTDRHQLEKALAQHVADEQQRIGREPPDHPGQ